MLVLREGVVTEAAEVAPEQQLVVDVPGRGPRAATADTALVGPCEIGDSVVINTAAADLALGSGGFDIVHVNLTRGLGGDGASGAHVMKLNYSSLQHAVIPVEDASEGLPEGRPVGVCFLHGQLAPARGLASFRLLEGRCRAATRGRSQICVHEGCSLEPLLPAQATAAKQRQYRWLAHSLTGSPNLAGTRQ